MMSSLNARLMADLKIESDMKSIAECAMDSLKENTHRRYSLCESERGDIEEFKAQLESLEIPMESNLVEQGKIILAALK